MDTQSITPARLAASVVAVPPLARNLQGQICSQQNARMVRYLEQAGITTLLYGGNALLYHIRPSEYASLLAMLSEVAADGTLVIPSVGPAFGMMIDQAEILRDFHFPTVMILPQKEIVDSMGIVRGVRALAESFGKPIVLYLKHDRWLEPQHVDALYREGLISWIKYAVVRDDPQQDNYLQSLIDLVPAHSIVSGIGEQPAIVHLRQFGIGSFTSGCVCIAPKLSLRMLRAIQGQDWQTAEQIRGWFGELESLRNSIHPIRILHYAVQAAGIAQTGSILPLLSDIDQQQTAAVAQAVDQLLRLENQLNSVT